MGDAAIKAVKSIKYEGVGTVEFLVDKKRTSYFMEMNTRIQVEHPVTEEVINYDLICEQIKAAAGIKISGKTMYLYYMQLNAALMLKILRIILCLVPARLLTFINLVGTV